MKKYLVLCNRHLSMYGEQIALFWGCDQGKSKGSYSSDIRQAFLFSEDDVKSMSDPYIEINELEIDADEFEAMRKLKLPITLTKEFIILNTTLSHEVVCQFELAQQEQDERKVKYGYCAFSDYRVCDGESCELYQYDELEEKNMCPENIRACECGRMLCVS